MSFFWHKRRNSIFRWVIIISIILGISTFFFFDYFSTIMINQMLEKDKVFWQEYKTRNNLSIICKNISYEFENPSFKVVIDDSLVVSAEKLTNIELSNDIRLKAGKHVVYISTIENNYLCSDSIEVDSFSGYYLLIDYVIDTVSLKKEKYIRHYTMNFLPKIVL